ncbi:uncharacterized protein [Palaemon carinicauda]|uniref:uncharacterized protein n=1 Tax=Palaemon carinicauda TaxID=392227 RepID=UPI0035B584FC
MLGIVFAYVLLAKLQKVYRQTDSPFLNLSIVLPSFTSVYEVPLSTSQGLHYLFTVRECSTRWPEAILMQTVMFALCKSAFCLRVIARFGLPEHITSDRGITFTPQLCTSLVNICLNPASKRIKEHFHCTLKAELMRRYNDSNWITQLPWVLLRPMTIPKDALDVSAAEKVTQNRFL